MKRFAPPQVLIGSVLTLCVMVGCYAHQGKPSDSSPDELMTMAESACQRYDRRAYETLLLRLQREHPSSSEAAEAKRLIQDSETCRPAATGSPDETQRSTPSPQ